jgi:hypothetical protein
MLDRLIRLSTYLGPWLRAGADRLFYWLDNRAPPSEVADKAIETLRPDLLVVTPLVNFDSREVDLLKAARRRGIPTMLAVASWDNLTNKGLIKVKPDRVTLWNEQMSREAHEFHGIAREDISIIGSTVFDGWFDRQPSRSRDSFCRLLDFDPDKPIIVYLCSTLSIVGKSEYPIIKEWLKQLRGAADPALAKANVLVRPHPMAVMPWLKLLGSDAPEKVKRSSATIWPVRATHPTLEQGRADFFDSLYHADAVVGLNTSAMIEAAILRTPVLTFVNHAAAQGQTGNLHFKYLTDSGCVLVANSMEQHIDQLATVLREPDFGAICDGFVQNFVRPLGRNQSASALLAKEMLQMIRTNANR